jgi:FtsP/CotA-like multicopper oxidase with cupredoxin domain
MSMGERWEVVIDFESFAGKSLYLKNFFKTEADVAYAATNQVMRFDIGTTVTDNSNNGPLPAAYNPLPVSTAKYDLQKPDHKFHFDYRGEWTINGVTFNDVKNRILAAPPRGTTQLWQLSTSRGWSHPIHLHLVDFKVVARTGGSRTSVLEYEKAGMKDVVLLGEGETVWVLAKYAPWEGVYMFHCHNLVHEDHAMMAVFNVSSLEGFNYPANNLKFIDPLDPRFRARPWAQEVETLDLVKGTVLPAFAGLGAYDDIEGVEKALDAFVTTATGLKDDKPVRK